MLSLLRAASVFVGCSVLVACGDDESTQDGDGGETCSDQSDGATCEGGPCGGDIVGTWGLVTFCAPSCVSSVYETVSFGADGSYNGGQGTWEYTGGDAFAITVGNATATHSFCVTGSLMWTQNGTNCGTESGPVTIVRQRDCGDGEPGR